MFISSFQANLNKSKILFLVITITSLISIVYYLKPNKFERIFVKSYYIITYPFKAEKIENILKNDINDFKSFEQKKTYFSNVMNKKEYHDYINNNLDNETYKKIISNINYIKEIGTNISSYWGAWRSGIQQGLEKPLLGIGPSGTRHNCKNLNEKDVNWLPGRNYCGNHPHNFYVQLFAETGILGLILGTLMFYNIITKCYNRFIYNANCPMYKISYIVPLALFFPIQQYGSFFGQWGNLFIWFSIGFSLAQIQINNRKINE